MATYNGERFLREQIDSIIQQKGVNVKLIISDDGSTDQTVQIIHEYIKKQKDNNISLCNVKRVGGSAKNFYAFKRKNHSHY